MNIEHGTKLAHYEVVEPIGKGGMGEVYRARDTKLGRDVAIKVLPEEFSHDKERLDRFEREARLLAQLNHANIATLHGLEESESQQFLVMELVEGETLAERIAKGPIPVDEAVPLFIQIAEGLEAAHEKGIIHRDLKPANIKIDPNDDVKILDFGLAKAFSPEEGTNSDTSLSPTLTKGTALGAVIGTASYMSPEQARGKAIDKRTDVWAFGCCLYEALTSKKAFEGETLTDILGAVVRAEPELGSLPHAISPAIARLLRRCLHKDRKHRLRDIGDAFVELSEWRVSEPAAADQKSPAVAGRLGVLLAGVALVALAVGYGVRGTKEPVRDVTPLHTSLRLPEGTELGGEGSPVVAISHDGTTVAYVGLAGGVERLYLHDLSTGTSSLVADSESAEGPFFSPDDEWVGFATNVSGLRLAATGELRKAPVKGGISQVICEVSDYFGGSWGTDGFIYFVDNLAEGIVRIEASGGTREPIPNTNGLFFPHVFSDAKALLAFRLGGDPTVVVYNLESGQARELGIPGGPPQFLRSGHVVTVDADGGLVALPFDETRLEAVGAPLVVDDGLAQSRHSLGVFEVSESGTLVRAKGVLRNSRRQPVDFSRVRFGSASYEVESLKNMPREAIGFAVSPDGERLAALETERIWIYDIERQSATVLPSKVATARDAVVWARDAQSILFSGAFNDAEGVQIDLFRQRVDAGTEAELLVSLPHEQYAGSVTPDGNSLLFTTQVDLLPGLARNIHMLSLDEPSAHAALVESRAINEDPQISPDARLLAYTTTEAGAFQVHVHSFPDMSQRVAVSASGDSPRWSWDGSELLYRDGTRIMRVPLVSTDTIVLGAPDVQYEADGIVDFHPLPNGDLIIATTSSDVAAHHHLEIVTNWFEELNQRAPREN